MPIDPTQHDPSPVRRSAFELNRQGRIAEAEAAARRALVANPDDGPILQLLGAIKLMSRRPAEACLLLERATRLLPDDAMTWNMRGVALVSTGQNEAAQHAFETAAKLQPDSVEALMNLGRLMTSTNRPEAAANAYGCATKAAPDDLKAWAALLAARRDLSDLAGCLEAHRQLVRLRPEDPTNRGMLLTALLHDESVSPEHLFEIVREQVVAILDVAGVRKVASKDEALPASVSTSFSEPQFPAVHVQSSRRLRIGYSSSSFFTYPMTRFIEPVLRHHDRDAVEITLYSDVPPKQEDATSNALQQLGPQWRRLVEWSDSDAADQIRADGIDVFVDLSGHMDSGRIGLMTHRVAPVQASYLAWPATTGLQTMDWRITDSNCDPVGMTEHLHTEKLIRIDPCCWAYNPTFGLRGDFPSIANRNCSPITFAAFNRLIKVTPRMLELWRRILHQVPDSRLIAIAGAKGAERAAHRQFIDADFPPDRVEVLPPMSRLGFLHRLGSADVLLDTFPYNGMTTTCDALFLGVPVVTLAGRSHVSRVGVSLMSAVGLNDSVASDEEMYVRRAVSLATNRPKLRSLQADLREQTRRSPLAQGRRLAEELEQAFRAMIGNR